MENRKVMHLALHPFVVGWDMMRFVRDKEHLLCIDRYFPLILERLQSCPGFHACVFVELHLGRGMLVRLCFA